MSQQFITRTAYNKNFGDGPDEVPTGSDDRFPLTILLADFLDLAAADGLVTGRWYWVPDATPDAPLWAYATAVGQYSIVNPARAMMRDMDMNSYAIRATDPVEGQIGSLTNFALSSGPAFGIVGSSAPSPSEESDLDRDLVVAGQSVMIAAPQIRMFFPGSEVGGTLVISAVEGDYATITAVPPVPPAYTVKATDATDVPIVSDGATWVVTALGIAPDFPTTQAFAIGDSARYSLVIENSGQAAATVDIGFQLEDAAVPGVWTGPAAWFSHLVTAGSSALYSNQSLLSQVIQTNTNIRMVARSTGVPTETDLGSWLYSGRALEAVLPGEFTTDALKSDVTTELRIAYTNGAGQDVSAFLLDLQTGAGMLSMTSGAAVTTFDLDTVTDDAAGSSVYLALSNGTGSTANWSGPYVLRGTLANGLSVIVAKGTASPTYFEVFEV